MELKKYKEAVTAFEKEVSLNSKDYYAHNRLGKAFLE